MKVVEGYMPFLGYQTYYRIVGENTKKPPLVLLHGGPGSGHNYFEVLDILSELDDRQLIMYDQIGCGNSYVEGRNDLWHKETWLDELDALRDHLHLDIIHLLGQSWGGMLLLEYICHRNAKGIQSIILSSTLPSSSLWAKEQQKLIQQLPQEMQDAINYATSTGNYNNPKYIEAEKEYMLLHCSGEVTEDSPECLKRPMKKNKDVYVTAWGPNEFTPLGNLKDYDVTNELKGITIPSLIISGENDLCTPGVAGYMHEHIPNSSWELFEGCRHMCFVEDNDKYIKLLKNWLNQNDSTNK